MSFTYAKKKKDKLRYKNYDCCCLLNTVILGACEWDPSVLHPSLL